MRNRPFTLLITVSVIVLTAAFCTPGTLAVEKAAGKVYAKPNDEKATVYFIRTKRFQGSGRTMFLYSDDSFLGVLDNDSYTFAYLDPGEHFLWLNWARVNRLAEFEAGETYYFVVWDSIIDVPEEEGKRRVEQARYYCQPNEKQIKTSEKHIAERRGKAKEFAEKDTGERAGSSGEREKHIAKWPKIDLSKYSILVIEDFKITDPMAGERKNSDLVVSAPSRAANLVRSDLDKGTFEQVLREKVDEPSEGTLILRVEFTQYKPGSKAARFMIAGAGAARLDFTARLIDAVTGEEVAKFSDERSWGWGGVYGGSGGIEMIEKNLAYELANYLERRVNREVQE